MPEGLEESARFPGEALAGNCKPPDVGGCQGLHLD